MTHVCPKCGAKIVVETDDSKHAEKRIEKCEKELNQFNEELLGIVERLKQ